MFTRRRAFLFLLPLLVLALSRLPLAQDQNQNQKQDQNQDQNKVKQAPADAPSYIDGKDLLANPVGANWTSYNGDYTGRRYSSLREIDTTNVHALRTYWVFHPGNTQTLEATPLVVDGVMYLTSANDAFA